MAKIDTSIIVTESLKVIIIDDGDYINSTNKDISIELYMKFLGLNTIDHLIINKKGFNQSSVDVFKNFTINNLYGNGTSTSHTVKLFPQQITEDNNNITIIQTDNEPVIVLEAYNREMLFAGNNNSTTIQNAINGIINPVERLDTIKCNSRTYLSEELIDYLDPRKSIIIETVVENTATKINLQRANVPTYTSSSKLVAVAINVDGSGIVSIGDPIRYTNQTVSNAGDLYYFDKHSNPVNNSIVTMSMLGDGDYKYYFDDKGRMVTGWYYVSYGTYAINHYFSKGSNYGAMITNSTIEIDGVSYTFDENGKVV